MSSGWLLISDVCCSLQMVDLHVLIVPASLWRADLRFAYNTICLQSISTGFVRYSTVDVDPCFWITSTFYWGGNPTSRGQTSQARPFPFSSTDPKDLACKTKGKHALDKLYSKPLSLDLKFSCISHSQPMVGYQYSTSLPAYCTQLHFTQTPPPLWKQLTY